jgi:hypothetical protein
MREGTSVEITVRNRDNQKFISIRDLIRHKQSELISYQDLQLLATKAGTGTDVYDAVVIYLRAEIDALKRMAGE